MDQDALPDTEVYWFDFASGNCGACFPTGAVSFIGLA